MLDVNGIAQAYHENLFQKNVDRVETGVKFVLSILISEQIDNSESNDSQEGYGEAHASSRVTRM